MKKYHVQIILLLAVAGLATVGVHHGWASQATQPAEVASAQVHAQQMRAIRAAVCTISPTKGNSVSGVVRFHQRGEQVHVVAKFSGLKPHSKHAWHIHEFGDITDPAGQATGGHYNPERMRHGLPDNPQRHAGDFGNLVADAQGHAHAQITMRNISLAGTHNPIIGRGMIIHAKSDDGGQPTGNAGARIGQGVIGIASSRP